MHRKQHLASADVIQRPPTIHIALQPATVEVIDQFIRNIGASKGIRTRSEAIQFVLDEALPRYGMGPHSTDRQARTAELASNRLKGL